MPVCRMLISTRPTVGTAIKDAFTNTLYFNVSGSLDEPGWQDLVDDLYAIQATTVWSAGRYIDIRAYDMGDPNPKPIKAQKQGSPGGTLAVGPPQIALALSYFADRNLPRQRGRIFIGPWVIPSGATANRPTAAQQQLVIDYGNALAGLGGLNVDWSIHSPTTDETTRISNIWCDNSWDVIRRRKLAGTSRLEATING